MWRRQLSIFKLVTYSIPFKSSSAVLDFSGSMLSFFFSSPDSSSVSCSSSSVPVSSSVLCLFSDGSLLFVVLMKDSLSETSTVFSIYTPDIPSSGVPERVFGLAGCDNANAVIG